MAYDSAWYDAAREWTVGKTGDEIVAKAQELGLTSSDIAKVYGGSDGSYIDAVTGYGSGSLNPDLGSYTYNGTEFVREQPKPAPAASGGGIPAMQQSVGLRQYEKNPYLDQMAAGITQQATRNLTENVLPGIRQQSIASGGYGGSRGAIAEGLAMGRTGDAIANSLSNLYGSDYQQSQNRNAQLYGMDQTYNLGLGNLGIQQQKVNNDFTLGQGQLGLGYAGLGNQLNIAGLNNDTQRYGIDKTYGLGLINAENNRYGTDKQYEVGMSNAAAAQANAAAQAQYNQGRLSLDQDQFGFNSALTLQDRLMGYNNMGLGAAGAIQNTPYNYWSQFSQGANSLGQGYGTQSTSGGAGNPLMGAIGGAQLGSQAANWYNTNYGGGGWGTGNQYGNQDLGAFL